MRNNINHTIVNEILSLRYCPSLDIENKKFTANDFSIRENPDYLDFIEKSILTEIINESKEKRTSIALSGGVDSTLVMALLRKALPDIEIEAISVKFADSLDETGIATKIADKFSANHHIITIENFLEELPKAISIIELPFWDIHWYHVAKTAHTFSKSLISGDGGDELFGGYTFRYKKFLANFNSNMTPIERTRLYLECHERDWVPDQEKLFGEKADFSWDDIYSKIVPFFDNKLSPIDQVFLADINGKLLYNWIPLNTRFHKFFGLNSITPILSKKLIEHATHLKHSLKYDPNQNIGKIPLRRILEKHIDSKLINPNKQGFSVNTVNLWKSYGIKICKYYLSNPRIVQDKWISKDWILKYLRKIEDIDDVRYVNKFLGLLAFEIWYRIFVTKEMKSEEKLTT